MDLYDENNLAIVSTDKGKYLANKDGVQVGGVYSYIENGGEGHYKVSRGLIQNIMRPDGGLVLREWHNNVYKVHYGCFIFSNTIQKSKVCPKTRYLYGVARVTGEVLFPMVFTNAHWIKGKPLIHTEIDGKPQILSLDGNRQALTPDAVPSETWIDYPQVLENIINWTLPGLQFFYRDTDVPIIAKDIYRVGQVLRAGFFIDVTPKLLRPLHTTRFIIGSAHAAMLCEIEDLCTKNPNVAKWKLCTLHYNSYFKVMDVYERDGCTQVFLLHIPEMAARLFGNGTLEMNIINNVGDGETLVDKARRSLDEKLSMEVHPRSMDKEFVARMYDPVGLDAYYLPHPLLRLDKAPTKNIENVGAFVHRLAGDADIEMSFDGIDNSPFWGVKGSVCEGCTYANGIPGSGKGCGRLSVKSFRMRYITGTCEYKKTDFAAPSLYEQLHSK